MAGLSKVVEIIQKIYKVLDSIDRRKSILILLDIVLAAMLETIGVGLIIPLITVIATPKDLMNKTWSAAIMKTLNISDGKQLLAVFGIFLVIFYVLKNIILIFSAYIQNRFRYGLQTKLSVKMLRAYLAHPYLFFVNTNSSEIMRGIGGDVGCVKDALEVIFNTLTQGLTIVFLAFFLVYTDAIMALVFLIMSAACMLCLVYGLKSHVKKLGVEQRVAEANTTKYSRELLDGIKDIYASKKQDKFLETYNRAFSFKSRINIMYSTILEMPNRIIETSFILGIVSIILVRSWTGMDMGLFVTRLAAFALAGVKILPSMSTLSRAMTQLIFLKPGVDETFDNISKYGHLQKELAVGGEKIVPFEKLEINNIWWRYNEENDDVIKGVSLEIKSGDSVAFIGGSGAGKTTIVDLILGLYQPQSGSITINGIDTHDFKGNWNKLFSYVQQNVFLLDDSIRKNIAFGEEENDIDDEKVWTALKKAQLDEFVRESEYGLDTIVGERGIKFSGGQRQRVAIARALYFDSDIIIFDEATAALDSATESAVMSAIDSLHGRKTLIIVAHRLSTIKNCDRIYEVKDGGIILRKWDEICDLV